MDTNKMREEFEEALAKQAAEDGFAKPSLRRNKNNGDYVDPFEQAAWWGWQASRAAVVVELPAVTDELLTAAYWDFDARRKGYPPYAAPAGQECGAFKVAIVSAIEAQGLKCEVKP
ncbi:hypothetical protein Q6A49_12555 [Pseudomonas sp. 22-AL-CL-001]|uniref:hypothetical protein n=1 Tax=Pseudomonas alabamensis TaxID=3064349 RepID=UPI0027131433|nr:hypothetical protein [Pseudomonas sp. 22-AL-CL-001]MDO7911364.1 hypothetical protein [Pseudomonas sp. 22-AL-CL-001]